MQGTVGQRSRTTVAYIVPVVGICAAAFLLTNIFIYLYLDSVYQPGLQQVSPLVGCVPQHFKMPTMKDCTAWLQCLQINAEVHQLKLIDQGAVKKVDRFLYICICVCVYWLSLYVYQINVMSRDSMLISHCNFSNLS